ncbi:cellulose synthase [Salinactinospora qingdaonensis]
MPTQLPIEGSMLGAALTIVGLLISWVVWRRRGAAAGLRGVAWSLLPLAAGLMGLMTILWGLVTEIVGFFAGLVFNPVVWAGVAVAALAVVLWVVSGVMRARGLGTKGRGAKSAKDTKAASSGGSEATAAGKGADRSQQQLGGAKAPQQQGSGSGDEDFGDIEEILRRRGIG